MKFSLPNLKNLWGKHRFFFLLLVLVVSLRLPSLFDPYSYGDEGIYLTLGEAARRGLVFYRDIYDNKPPLLYLLAAASGSLFWFRFLLLVWNLATIYLFFSLAQILFPKNQRLNKIATLIFAVFSSIPLLEGNIANAEIFMILPILAGIFLIFEQEKLTPRVLFATGILFSLAALFKIPAVFDFLAILTFLVFFYFGNFRKNISHLTFHLSLILGFCLPILSTILYYWSQSGLSQYLQAAFLQNIPYLSSWGSGSSSGFFASGVVRRGILVVAGVAVIWLLRKRWSANTSLIFVWFLFALFGATLSGRPYPHYLIQILPPAVFLLIILLGREVLSKIIVACLFGSLLLATLYFKFWSYPTLTYYQNFLAFAFRQKTQEEYFKGFGDKTLQTYKLAQFLITHTLAQERIFIWGDSPVVYALSRRLPASRYTASYHIIDFDGFQETIKALEENPPRLIIDLQDEKRSFPQLNNLLSQKYFLLQAIVQAQVFHLNPGK